jgi:hypothetical protein
MTKSRWVVSTSCCHRVVIVRVWVSWVSGVHVCHCTCCTFAVVTLPSLTLKKLCCEIFSRQILTRASSARGQSGAPSLGSTSHARAHRTIAWRGVHSGHRTLTRRSPARSRPDVGHHRATPGSDDWRCWAPPRGSRRDWGSSAAPRTPRWAAPPKSRVSRPSARSPTPWPARSPAASHASSSPRSTSSRSGCRSRWNPLAGCQGVSTGASCSARRRS